jgi:hypothetical protein
MKIEKQLPVSSAASSALDTRSRARTQAAPGNRQEGARAAAAAENRTSAHTSGATNGFNLQLNQQLSSMQAADRYLGDLAEHLSTLKLSISRQISSPASSERDTIAKGLEQVNELLEQRSKRTSQSLDASFNLRLNEPLRSRFSLPGLDSVEAIKRSGRETLVFTAGRALQEPLAVVLDDGMSDEQVLRNFNAGLGSAGIRAELDSHGALKFSMPENDWNALKGQLKVNGENKLFAANPPSQIKPQEEGLLEFNPAQAQESVRELRQMLDSVIVALDRIGTLRQQLSQRQEDVREFLTRQESQDEKQWALNFASAVFNINGRKASNYSAVSQTVVAQAQLTRFAVVSLLS